MGQITRIDNPVSGYVNVAKRNTAETKYTTTKYDNSSSQLLKYTQLPKIAFGSQLAQIIHSEKEDNLLDQAKIFPVEGVEHAKEWPIPVNLLKKLKERYGLAHKFNNIKDQYTPNLGVYNISTSGRQIIGVFDILVNKLTITEGIVLFEMDKTANIVDEALAHESYHCKRAHAFSALSDSTVTRIINDRLFKLLTTGNLPMFELIAGEKLASVDNNIANLLVRESVKPVDEEISRESLEKLKGFIPDYDPESKKFFIKMLRKLRCTYEKSVVVGYEKALKDNIFNLEDFGKRIPEKMLQKIMLSKGLSKEEAIRKIVIEQTGKLLMMGYISPIEASEARSIRTAIQKQAGIKEGSSEETLLIKDMDNIFDMIDASYNLGLAGNDKAKEINQFKVMEEYMYCHEEINARQTGLQHKINLLKEKMDKIEGYAKREIQTQISVAEADYKLNEMMLELIKLRNFNNKNPEVSIRIEELTKEVTELSKIAEHTLPKLMGFKHLNYVPFSYGDSYREIPEELKKYLKK